MAREPDDRHASAAELALALRPWQERAGRPSCRARPAGAAWPSLLRACCGWRRAAWRGDRRLDAARARRSPHRPADRSRPAPWSTRCRRSAADSLPLSAEPQRTCRVSGGRRGTGRSAARCRAQSCARPGRGARPNRQLHPRRWPRRRRAGCVSPSAPGARSRSTAASRASRRRWRRLDLPAGRAPDHRPQRRLPAVHHTDRGQRRAAGDPQASFRIMTSLHCATVLRPLALRSALLLAAALLAACAAPPPAAPPAPPPPVGLAELMERPAERALVDGIRAYDDGQYARRRERVAARPRGRSGQRARPRQRAQADRLHHLHQ